MPIDSFRLAPADIRFAGENLSRPECVLCEADGTLWVSDNRAALLRIDANGRQTLVGAMKGAPNGIALAPDGLFYIANIGDAKVYAMTRDGKERVICTSLAGRGLGSCNFTYLDPAGRLWVTISTYHEPRAEAARNPRPDGVLFRIDLKTGRAIKALDGLHFTNEVRVRDGWMYIVETSLGRIVRAPIKADGRLGELELYGPSPVFHGAMLDGIAFDADGNLWATDVARNSIVVITPERRAHVVFQDPDAKVLNRPASIAFGGPGRRTAYIGSLSMTRLGVFESPVAGASMVHW